MHGFAYIFYCWGWFNFIYVVGLLFFMCKFFGHPVYYRYNAKKFLGLIKFHWCYFLWQLLGFFFFFRTMSASSSQRRVRQRTEEGIAATKVRIENRQAIPERNVVQADVMVAPLDIIANIIQTYHWRYLYNCACIMLPRLVREFYGILEMLQDDDSGIILQYTVQGHVFQVDPQVISRIIGVPVLSISANPFNEILEPPSDLVFCLSKYINNK
jgi:hypothetical protein